MGSHPGCGLYDFDWRYYWSYQCPDPYDKCVKVIEQKGGKLVWNFYDILVRVRWFGFPFLALTYWVLVPCSDTWTEIWALVLLEWQFYQAL